MRDLPGGYVAGMYRGYRTPERQPAAREATAARRRLTVEWLVIPLSIVAVLAIGLALVLLL